MYELSATNFYLLLSEAYIFYLMLFKHFIFPVFN